MTRSYTLIRRGKQIDLPQGFSWTTFFFGFWPSILRLHFWFAVKLFFFESLAVVFVLALMSGAGGIYGQVPPGLFVFLLGLLVMLRCAFARARNASLKAFFFEDDWKEYHEPVAVAPVEQDEPN